MAEHFEVTELVKIAVEDERTGVAFYSRLEETTDKLKGVFAKLAEEEAYHQQRFERMLEDLGGHSPHEQDAGEYMDYLVTLTGGRAFPDEQTAMKLADQCADDAAAVALAMQFEKDTLMLMNEMRSLLPEKHQDVINELVKEEQSHLVTLNRAKAQL